MTGLSQYKATCEASFFEGRLICHATILELNKK